MNWTTPGWLDTQACSRALAAQSKKTIAGPIVSSVVSCSSSALIPK